MLLYDFCLENEYIKEKDDFFYDKLHLKSLIYSLNSEDDSLLKDSPKSQEIQSANEQSIKMKSLTSELMRFLNLNEPASPTTAKSTTDKKSIAGSFSSKSITGSFNNNNNNLSKSFVSTKSITSSMSELSVSGSIISDCDGSISACQLSAGTKKIFENLLIQSPLKAKSIFDLIFKYNRPCQNEFLKGLNIFFSYTN